MSSPTKSPSKKRLKFAVPVELGVARELSETRRDWSKCCLCSGDGKGRLQCAANNSNKAFINAGYRSMACMLNEFEKLGLLPESLKGLDEGKGLEQTFIDNKAKWHVPCGLKYSRQALTRLKKSRDKENEQTFIKTETLDTPTTPLLGKRDRVLRSVETPLRADISRPLCVLCGAGPTWKSRLHEVSGEKVEEDMRTISEKHPDPQIRATLSGLFIGRSKKKYHKTCLSRCLFESGDCNPAPSSSYKVCESIAFAELIEYVTGQIENGGQNQVFKMASLVQMHTERLAHLLGCKVEEQPRTHSTRLRERILKQVPDLEAKIVGRDVHLVPKDAALYSVVVEEDFDQSAIVFKRFVKLLRGEMESFPVFFSGNLNRECQTNSVPPALLATISQLLFGAKAQMLNRSCQPALTISQLILFNFKKSFRNTTSIVRHEKNREPPLPVYIGLSMWGKTRKREVIDILHGLGLSISSTRVQELTASLCQWTVDRASQEGFLCPANLLSGVFTVSAYDNIDHNPSSSTSVGAFHGTGISILQLPTVEKQGEARTLLPAFPDFSSRFRRVPELPDSYGIVKALNLPSRQPKPSLMENIELIPPPRPFCEFWRQEISWLQRVAAGYKYPLQDAVDFSWSAFHASRQNAFESLIPGTNALLPLFYEDSASVSMVCHGLNITKRITEEVNPGQTPVITADQPLFTLIKLVQWTWPNTYGENKLFPFFAPFHIEQAFSRVIGAVMEGCGWVSVVSSAGILSETSANSCLAVNHVKRAREIHQITAATLHILLEEAYLEESPELTLQTWIKTRSASSDLFYFWIIILNLEILLLQLVHSLRCRNYSEYCHVLRMMMPWFFSMDRHNYSRWVSVHIKDLDELPKNAPDVYQEFIKGNFSFTKTKARFSAMGFDQVHEQNNAVIKADGGAIGLTEDPEALRRWMLAGPEVKRLLNDFEADYANRKEDSNHHEQYRAFQDKFHEKVRNLKRHFVADYRNPFLHSTKDLIAIDTHIIVGQEGSKDLRRLEEAGNKQYETFIRTRLYSGETSLYAPIKKNNFRIFLARKKKVNGVKLSIKALQTDVELFSKLYMTAGTRQLETRQFFRYENQLFPPALSKDGNLYPHSKSDLVPFLEKAGGSDVTVSPTNVQCLIYDGAALVHIVQPRIVKTFADYSEKTLQHHLSTDRQTFSASRIDLVWDLYFPNSLKTFVREGRGSGVKRQVLPGSPIPKNWIDFLHNDDNKKQLFRLLAYSALSRESTCLMVTNVGDTIISSPTQSASIRTSLSGVSCGAAEEADTRIILHLKDAVENGCSSALIRTVDTDVLTLSVSFFHAFERLGLRQLWVRFGVGAKERFIACHDTAHSLGDRKAQALRAFHAFIGCDLTSGFRGKKVASAWKTWMENPEVTETFYSMSLPLSQTNVEASIFQPLEKFVISMYGGDVSMDSIDDVRLYMYTKKGRKLQDLPPTRNALHQHILRSAYQAGQVWGQADLKNANIPSPEGWGWGRTDEAEKWVPIWTTIPSIWEACGHLLKKCGCKTGCGSRCSCRKAKPEGVSCTIFCLCNGECTNRKSFDLCGNAQADPPDECEDSDPDDPSPA